MLRVSEEELPPLPACLCPPPPLAVSSLSPLLQETAMCPVTAEVCCWGWGDSFNCEAAGSTTASLHPLHPKHHCSLKLPESSGCFFQSLGTQLLSPGEGSDDYQSFLPSTYMYTYTQSPSHI